MTDKQPKPVKIVTINPRYKEATPEIVGKALLKQRPKPSTQKPPAGK